MENNLPEQTNNNELAQKKEASTDVRIQMQNFTKILNTAPSDGIDNTSDGKAYTINISHVEMTLDELFFGAWSTENFKWSVIQNEIVGSLDLIVIHPSSGMTIKRTGAASIQIMVDAMPEEYKDKPSDTKEQRSAKRKLRNEWALNVSNKKSSALDMGFPKLKAECFKNAAQSLGKLFGRDLNRGAKSDIFKPLIKTKETVN